MNLQSMSNETCYKHNYNDACATTNCYMCSMQNLKSQSPNIHRLRCQNLWHVRMHNYIHIHIHTLFVIQRTLLVITRYFTWRVSFPKKNIYLAMCTCLVTHLGGSSIATTILLEESPDYVFLLQLHHVFFSVFTFTRLLLTIVTCILIMSVLGEIKVFFFFLLQYWTPWVLWWPISRPCHTRPCRRRSPSP